MSYYYDEHDEDDLPEITIPAKHYTRDLSDDDDDDDEQAKNSLQSKTTTIRISSFLFSH